MPPGGERPFGAVTAEDQTFPKWNARGIQRAFFGVDIEFGANADEIWLPRPIALLSVVDETNISTICCGATRKRRWRASRDSA